MSNLTYLSTLRQPFTYFHVCPPLVQTKIQIDLDLNELFRTEVKDNLGKERIREKKNNGAIFSTPNNQDYISSITLFTGEGRRRKERKISLTKQQGRFLFHLPFPNSDHSRMDDIMKKAELPKEDSLEILDLIDELINFGIIETKKVK